MPHPETCETCPNKGNCDFPAEAFSLAYQGSRHLISRVLERNPPSERPKPDQETARMVIRGLISALVETAEEYDLPSHAVMMDVTLAMDKVYSSEEPHQDDIDHISGMLSEEPSDVN